jgi:hypothetical protein
MYRSGLVAKSSSCRSQEVHHCTSSADKRATVVDTLRQNSALQRTIFSHAYHAANQGFISGTQIRGTMKHTGYVSLRRWGSTPRVPKSSTSSSTDEPRCLAVP